MIPKYDCRFIVDYYYDILEDLDFLDVLPTAVGSEFNPSALEAFKFEFDISMTGVKTQKVMFELVGPKFPNDRLCEKCRYKFQCRLGGNNIFKPIL